MKRVGLLTAALVAAVAVWWWSLPLERVTLATPWSDGTVRGLLHVHSQLSDGRGSADDIAAAAARAGLQFVVLTDHGDGTRRPDAPAYRAGVLVIDGVEISTRGGHYVAVGLPQSPYPLAGDPADVVEDVRRMGGFGIVAHPDSPKPELRWTDWSAPFDAVELINPDTSWRVRASRGDLAGKWLLGRSLLAYPARPV
ncbi:MAG: PHP domain-containing protein, partial [Vicinamibacterales bacterium]